MNIDKTIKKLRLERDLTQEQLAEYLHVSVSAISQWENGKTLPDVPMLLSLAGFFEVSLDELFDRTGTDKQKAIEEYDTEATVLANQGRVREQLALWREAVQRFPGDFHCLISLAHVLNSTRYASGDFGDLEANARECITICERILRDCTDTSTRDAALQLLVLTYSDRDSGFADEEKAVRYAQSATGFYVCREMLLEHAYFTEKSSQKQKEIKQDNIIHFMDLLTKNLYYGKYDTEEDKIRACKASLALWETLIYDGNYLFYHCRIENIYKCLARSYAVLQKREETLEALKQALYHAKRFDGQPAGKQSYTSVFLSATGCDAELCTKNYEHTDVESVKSFMQSKWFDFLRENAEFVALQ